MSWKTRLQEAWYQGHPALYLLTPLELLYRWVVKRRRQRFLTHPELAWKAPVPVVVVGNITLGGTGKTPLTLWLIEHCKALGIKVGVVSRGYGAQPPHFPWRVAAGQSSHQTGDEPLMMVERTQVPLYIDPKRPQAAQALLAAESVDLIIADDGLQHYPLARDLELVVVDAQRGFGNGHCLPAGPLREPLECLNSVDAVVYNGPNSSEQAFSFNLQPQALVHIQTGQIHPLTLFSAGQRVHAVAGIGHPARFFHTLEQLNWMPIPHVFDDHAVFAAEQLVFTPELPVIMTEKDAVKCRAFAQPNWYALQVQARPSEAFVSWFDQQLARLLPLS